MTTIAVTQTAFSNDSSHNVQLAKELVRSAAGAGAQIILLPELFSGRYFPQHQNEENFAQAGEMQNHPLLNTFAELAAELSVVLPISFFERSGREYYNSVAILDADGTLLGIYRKSHIPDGPGYQEKYYFRPGNTGFRVWKTHYGTIGVGICWDQWFPEAARAMVLLGADLLLYPSAIGSEPAEPELDTRAPWQRVMVGHAVANVVPVAAANRVGTEEHITFYGNSFIADHQGDITAQLNDHQTGYTLAELDLQAIRQSRDGWGFFRDRRPDLYTPLTK